MPLWLYGTMFVLVSTTVSIGGLLLVRKYVPVSVLRAQHDVAGFLIAIVGVIYAVLLAFVVIVVWERFDNAKVMSQQEANALKEVYRMAHAFPDPGSGRVRQEALDYANLVVVKEWPAMAEGRESPAVGKALDRLWESVEALHPQGTVQSTFYSETVHAMNDVGNNRRLRILASRSGLPNVMWFVLISGGVITVAFTYFFGLENASAQIIMTTLLAIDIALALFLIGALDFPFTGDVKVQPAAWESVLQRLQGIHANEAKLHSGTVFIKRPAPDDMKDGSQQRGGAGPAPNQ